MKILIEISGGVLSAVHASEPDVEVILWDYDNIQAGDAPPGPVAEDGGIEPDLTKYPHPVF